MKRSALAALAVAVTAAGSMAVASPARAATTPPTDNHFPNCNLQVDPGGPCNVGAYGLDEYSTGMDNCTMAMYNQLARFRAQGYRTAMCALQNRYPNPWTVMTLYK